MVQFIANLILCTLIAVFLISIFGWWLLAWAAVMVLVSLSGFGGKK